LFDRERMEMDGEEGGGEIGWEGGNCKLTRTNEWGVGVGGGEGK
jgi:hypothetical protein